MNHLQRGIFILMLVGLALVLIAGGWKDSFFGVATLIILWLNPRESQLSKQAKIFGYGFVFILMAVGCFFLYQRFKVYF